MNEDILDHEPDSYVIERPKKYRLLVAFELILLVVSSTGGLLRLLSWPYSNEVLFISLTALCIMYLLVWPFTKWKHADTLSLAFQKVVSLDMYVMVQGILFSILRYPGLEVILQWASYLSFVATAVALFAIVTKRLIAKPIASWTLWRLVLPTIIGVALRTFFRIT